MDRTKFEQLMNVIENQLSEKRSSHTLRVMAEAKALAGRHGVDEEKAEFAALCHDMARCKSSSEAEAFIHDFGLDPRYADSIELSHSKIAAELLKREWGVGDMDILNAVAYHTTGRPAMSDLEKVIYLADAIEPGREYPGVNRLRRLAREDLDKACLEAMNRTIEYVTEKGCKIDEDTIRARESLLAKERGADE